MEAACCDLHGIRSEKHGKPTVREGPGIAETGDDAYLPVTLLQPWPLNRGIRPRPSMQLLLSLEPGVYFHFFFYRVYFTFFAGLVLSLNAHLASVPVYVSWGRVKNKNKILKNMKIK